MLARFKSTVAKFHKDEAGLEALQVVMILAIAAVCLIVLKSQWTKIRDWFTTNMNGATGEEAFPK